MSLISSLHLTFSGMQNTEARLDVASSNVTNADKTGYTKKSYATDYTTTSSGTAPSGGTVVTTNYDEYLYKTVLEDATESGYYDTLANSLSNYVARLGGTSDDSTISSAMDDYAAALDALTQSPDDASLKSEVVRSAELLTNELRTLSSSIQDLRAQADQDIETSVLDINALVENLDQLNDNIIQAEAFGQSTADLEDERRTALETLSTYVDVDYFFDGQNRLNIYLEGRPLLDSQAHELSYTASNSVNSSVTYPGGFNAISLGGVDMTTSINEGALGALIELRDSTLVDEQEKLDALSTTLMDEMNALLNQGASLPARSDIIGETLGIGTFAASGSVRISTVDENGTIIASADIDLTTITNNTDLAAAINTALGADVTASITASGALQLTANNTGEGIAMNQLDSDVDGQNFSQYFGMNNMFTGTGAENIYVSDYLLESGDYLATSFLSDTAIVGEAGVFPGDSSLAEDMQNLLSASVSFNAAGNFTAQNTSMIKYASNLIADAASSASSASQSYESADALYLATKSSLENLSGVNIDEEMAAIVELESKYEAAATLLATIQSMFDELIAAVR